MQFEITHIFRSVLLTVALAFLQIYLPILYMRVRRSMHVNTNLKAYVSVFVGICVCVYVSLCVQSSVISLNQHNPFTEHCKSNPALPVGSVQQTSMFIDYVHHLLTSRKASGHGNEGLFRLHMTPIFKGLGVTHFISSKTPANRSLMLFYIPEETKNLSTNRTVTVLERYFSYHCSVTNTILLRINIRERKFFSTT